MRFAVLTAAAMAAGLAGPSHAAGFLSDMASKLDILPDNTRRLDRANIGRESVIRDAIARDAGRPDTDPYLKSMQAERQVRIPGPPTPILLTAGPSVCRTSLGACTVNVLATAGQACWCPTDDGYAAGTVAP